MEIKPKINLILSPFDKSLEMIGKMLLFIMLALTVYTFIKLPASIPTHFNAAGHANSYDNKAVILIFPILGTTFYFVFTLFNKVPYLFNYMTKITPENARQQYITATRMLRFVKLAILLLFTVIILFTYLTSIGAANGLGSWFVPFTVALLLLPTVFLVIQSLKLKNKNP
jgi:uncharacterized membrane protein